MVVVLLIVSAVLLYVLRGVLHYANFLPQISERARGLPDHVVAFVQVVFFWPSEVKRTRVKLPDECDRCGEDLEDAAAEIQDDGSVRMRCSCGRIQVLRG